MAVSWLPPYRGLGRPYHSAHAYAPARAVSQRPALCHSSLARCISRHSPAVQAPYVTIQNLALQYNSLPALQPQSRYKLCIVTRPSVQPTFLSHNTSNVLRYTFCLAYPLPVTIQFGLYRDMLIPQPAYLSVTIHPVCCDTLFSPPSLQPVAIQGLISQYSPLPKLATSQPHQVTI